jgi:O-antigen/teichoic acid export membrane protein
LVSDIYLGLFQQRRVMRPSGLSSAVRGALSTLLFTIVLYATRNLVYAAGALALGCVTVLAVWDCRAPVFLRLRASERRFRWGNLHRLFRVAAPLGIAVLLVSLNANIPRYFVHAAAGNSGLGVFSALASVQAAGFLVVNALGQVIIPRLARAHNVGDLRGFRKLVFVVLGALAVACGGAIVLIFFAGDRLITLLFGAAYAGQNRTLLALTAAASLVFASSILSSAATAAKKLVHQAAAMAAATATTAIGCYFLVPRMGGFGAALSALASSALSFALLAAICSDELRRLPSSVNRVLPVRIP